MKLYSKVHLSFRRFDLSFARPLDFDESSVFRDRISRMRSKNTYKVIKNLSVHLNYLHIVFILFSPYQHSHGFLLTFRHMVHLPIVALVLDILTMALYACHSNRIYCPPAETGCSHHSSHAIFAL